VAAPDARAVSIAVTSTGFVTDGAAAVAGLVPNVNVTDAVSAAPLSAKKRTATVAAVVEAAI
jgi:hypothetical protein